MLENINSPQDIKSLSIEELNILAEDIRRGILNRTNTVGGHLGPDLGIVEATLAIHYVFNSPKDKLVPDVSHQCYPHKMITGRKSGFLDPLNNMNISGYSNPAESEHDFFVLGHTSTSISLASGMVKARDLKGENYNVIALIGDGSLSGGEALEGLNNGAVLNSNFIIVVNDNEMSIAPTYGGLFKNLAELRNSNGKSENNIFKAMGYDYYYLDEGNDVEKLIKMFEKVKDTTVPTVVHIHTLKGKGFEPAETDKERYHYQLSGFLDSKNNTPAESYTSVTTDYLLAKKQSTKELLVVSPATPGATGFSPEFRASMGENYTDVDIAEQHAVGYVSGMAVNGGKPVLAVLSSFIQRAYDQLSQDLALNKAPATILVYWGAITGADMTHLGIFDIPLISNIPNIVYLAPTTKEEYLAMLDWSVEQDEHPVAIKVPFGPLVTTGEVDMTDYSILNRFKFGSRGKRVAVIGAGNFYHLALEVEQEVKSRLGMDITVINPVYLTGLDEEALNSLRANHELVITLEDGCIAGGFGEKVSRFYSNSDMKVLNYGAEKEFTDRIPLQELYTRFRLTKELITEDITKFLNK